MDCNKCKYLTKAKENRCLKYDVRVFHRGNNPKKHYKLIPCGLCMKDMEVIKKVLKELEGQNTVMLHFSTREEAIRKFEYFKEVFEQWKETVKVFKWDLRIEFTMDNREKRIMFRFNKEKER